MSLDFRNINSLWSSILTETLQRLGLNIAIICPGSRSTSLTVAFSQQSQITAIPVLDERSAAFFALGIAKKSGLPVVLVCTSGTAGANFYPAIIEAKESRIPLLILTADRPSELRNCHSGQTIDQVKLYGNYPNWQTELAVPSSQMEMLRYLRQTLIYAWERSLFPVAGAVHLNIPFRDPLSPISDATTELLKSQFQPEEFFANVNIDQTSNLLMGRQDPQPTIMEMGRQDAHPTIIAHPTIKEWQKYEQGVIIAGTAQPQFPETYVTAIAHLSKFLGFPVLAEGLSPLRNYAQLNPYLISTYDLILRNQELATQLKPEIVIQIGELPTSKELRNWLDYTQPQRWVIDDSDHNLDPLHGKTIHLRLSIQNLSTKLSDLSANKTKYLQLWCETEAKVRQNIDGIMSKIEYLFEGKTAWLLSQILPPETQIFISNSMPVRDVEFFWKPNNLAIKPFFNRGANGIDGTLSTALGVAYQTKNNVMLTGDLALLHDTNGFLIKNKFVGHLTIILINNNGGGIFEMLPISKFEPPFEEFFGTPQNINFANLCATYNVEHQLIKSWEDLQEKLNPLPTEGIRVLELQTNRREDAKWRKENLSKFAETDIGR